MHTQMKQQICNQMVIDLFNEFPNLMEIEDDDKNITFIFKNRTKFTLPITTKYNEMIKQLNKNCR